MHSSKRSVRIERGIVKLKAKGTFLNPNIPIYNNNGVNTKEKKIVK
jgi:hypothetical protein